MRMRLNFQLQVLIFTAPVVVLAFTHLNPSFLPPKVSLSPLPTSSVSSRPGLNPVFLTRNRIPISNFPTSLFAKRKNRKAKASTVSSGGFSASASVDDAHVGAHTGAHTTSKGNGMNDISPTNKRDMQSLTQWAANNSFELSPLINLSSNDENAKDYGVTLNQQKLNESEGSGNEPVTILSVPKSFVFDSREIYLEWAKSETKRQFIKPSIEYIEQNGNFVEYINHFFLIVKLLEEYALGSKSKWHTWIQSLPKTNADFHTGVNMDDVEMSCLPPFALALANHEKEKLDVLYNAFQLIQNEFFSGDNDNDNDNAADGADENRIMKVKGEKEIFQWMFNIVHTRCWSYEDEMNNKDSDNQQVETIDDESDEESGESRPIIVPLGDMFNHREPANVFVQDSSSSDVVDFIYSDQNANTADSDSNVIGNTELFLSYGLTNPHRFLIIFGFSDITMPEIFSQLIFANPSDEMIALGCNDRSEMVYRTEDGGIANSVWDCVVYTLLKQVPAEQTLFYDAFLKGDKVELRRFHEKYLLEAALTLRPHVVNNIGEQRELLGRIDGIMKQVESDGLNVNQVHPQLSMIRQHNQFLYNVFELVRQRLDGIAEMEVKKRREAQLQPQ